MIVSELCNEIYARLHLFIPISGNTIEYETGKHN